MMHLATAYHDVNHERDALSLSPSSSPLSSPLESDPNGIDKSSNAAATISPRGADGRHHFARDEDADIPISTWPGLGETGPGHTLSSSFNGQGPGTQNFPTMQMQKMEAPDSSSTPYRIPSSVFARSKSGTPMEWSVASNESLFSIHTGNASFTKDQMYWLERCEGDEAKMLRSDTELFFSGPLLDFSAYPTPNNQPAAEDMPAEVGEHSAGDTIVDVKQQAGFSVTSPKSDEPQPVKKAKPVSGDELTKEISLAKGVAHSHAGSRVSDDGSCKSFAFPVLARNDTSGLATPKKNVETHSPKAKEWSSEMPKQQPEAEGAATKKPEAASTPAASAACCTWFSCFTGCGAAPRS